MPRKATKVVIPTQIEKQQAKVAEHAAKKARKKQVEESSEELRIKLTDLIHKQLPQIERDLADMTAKERCDTIAKLAPYVLPRLSDKRTGEEAAEQETDELSELATRTTGETLMN